MLTKFYTHLLEGMKIGARVTKKAYGEKQVKYLHVFGLKMLNVFTAPGPAPKRAKKVNTVTVIFSTVYKVKKTI